MNYSFKIPDWLSYRKLFVVLSSAIFIILPILSIDAGISGDEPVHYQHAEYVYNYFSSKGQDQSAVNTPKTYLKFYGQGIDNLSYLINKKMNSKNPYLTRHLLNAILGALMIIFSGLIAVRLSGYRAGILTMIFIFLSPRILGHSYNNLKDIPFALGYIVAIYGLISLIRNYPSLKPGPLIWMCLGLAIAFGTRAGGLILIPIFLFFIFLKWITSQGLRELKTWPPWRKGLVFFCVIMITCTAGSLLAILNWPFALEAPVRHSLESLKVMTNYSISIRQLFEGQWVWSEHLPGYYPLKYILISTPIVIIIGFGIQFLIWKRSKTLLLVLMNFVVLFPIAWVIIKGSNLYGAWRHLLFVYPAFAILSACSWDELLRLKKSLVLKMSIAGFILIGLAGPLVHIIKYHPVEYLYFNKSVGGVSGAFDKYETDYYYHSLGPATKWLKEYLNENEAGKTLIVASNFPPEPYFKNDPGIIPRYTHYFSRAKIDWDYGIFVNTFLGPDYLNSQNWPPDHNIFNIEIDGKVICTIIKRASKADLEGINLYRNQDYAGAIEKLKSALAVDPQNETAQLYLGWAYNQSGDLASSDDCINKLLDQQPMNDMARDLGGRNKIAQGEFESALETFQILLKQNYKYLPAYEQAARAADSLGNYKLAAQMLEKGYHLGLKDKNSIEKLINYQLKAGYNTRAQEFRTILNKK